MAGLVAPAGQGKHGSLPPGPQLLARHLHVPLEEGAALGPHAGEHFEAEQMPDAQSIPRRHGSSSRSLQFRLLASAIKGGGHTQVFVAASHTLLLGVEQTQLVDPKSGADEPGPQGVQAPAPPLGTAPSAE